jgi:hypothetical protein
MGGWARLKITSLRLPCTWQTIASRLLRGLDPLESVSRSETTRHKELKRMALIWAQAQGYRAAAAEVSLPNYRFRLDVAAYKAARIRETHPDGRRKTARPAIGLTAVFECKASKADYLRDAHSIALTNERLKALHERKSRIENELLLHYPSILNGDSLFQEYQSINFERPGHERYQRTLEDIRRLARRLHANTKFDRLVKWGAANLFWVVAEPGMIAMHELPAGWGLLLREDDTLRAIAKPLLHEVAESERLALFHRIALAASRAVNREHRIAFDDLRQAQ